MKQFLALVATLLPPFPANAEWAVIGVFANFDHCFRQRVWKSDIRSVDCNSAQKKSLKALDENAVPHVSDWSAKWPAVLSIDRVEMRKSRRRTHAEPDQLFLVHCRLASLSRHHAR